MTASLPVVISCSRPCATCSYTAVADTGVQVSVANRLLLGDLGISQRQLQTTPMAVTHVTGGSKCLLGTITCQVSVGTVSITEHIYIAEDVQQLYLSLKVCKALRLVRHTFLRPLAPTSVCAVEPSDTPQAPLRPESPPYELVNENVDRLEKWFLEHFGRTVFAMGRTPLPEMSGPPHHIHLRPDARPHAVHVPATVPLHFFDEVRRQLDDDVDKGIIEVVPAGEPTE